MNDASFFSAPLTLPYSAINANGSVKVDWILNVFQDAASQHCSLLGISGFDMAKVKLKWVVAQYQICIHHELKMMMPLIVKTWRKPWKNLYEVRGFSLSTEDGHELVTATGIWILIKAANGKPVRLGPYMPAKLMGEPARQGPEILKPGQFTQYHHETQFPVCFHDLDLNQHVNNSVYLRWAVNTIPEPYCFDFALSSCAIVYRKESLFNDTVLSRLHLGFSKTGLSTEHAILHEDSRSELARLKVKWKKIRQANG